MRCTRGAARSYRAARALRAAR